MGLRWPSRVDGHRFCLMSRSDGFLTIHAHWRFLPDSEQLLVPVRNVWKRLQRFTTGVNILCTQYLRNLVKISSKKSNHRPIEPMGAEVRLSGIQRPLAPPRSTLLAGLHSQRTSTTPEYPSPQHTRAPLLCAACACGGTADNIMVMGVARSV